MNMLHIAALVLLAIDDALETTAKLTRNGPSAKRLRATRPGGVRRYPPGSSLHRRVELMSDITRTVLRFLKDLKTNIEKAEAILTKGRGSSEKANEAYHKQAPGYFRGEWLKADYPEDEARKWAFDYLSNLPSPEAVRKKVDCVIRAFTKRASGGRRYLHMHSSIHMLRSNDETKRLANARVIWDEDGRPKKADGAPDLRFKPREKMNVKFVHPRPAKTPAKTPVPVNRGWHPDAKAAASKELAAYDYNVRMHRDKERRRARREAAVLARRRSREQHKSKVLKENGCHIREKNFWLTLALKDGKWIGHRTCDLCTEILRTDDSLGDKEKKALKRCKNYHFTKPKKQGEKPTRFKHRKTRSKKKVPEKRSISDPILGTIKISFDEDGFEVWTVREMKKHSDTDALQYLAGTPEHKAREGAARQAAILAGLEEFEDETQIQEDARTLEEATHMARKVTLPTTRGAPPMAESTQ